MRICFSIPVPKDSITLDGSRFYTVCYCIPMLIDPWWKKFRKPGDPIELFTDGWIRSEQIGMKQARDLSILATVHELVGQLSPQIQGVLEAPVKQAFKTIELPDFATLSFDKQVEKEYK